MKRYLWMLSLLLSAVPALAQDPDEAVLREMGIGGVYAVGNLALKDLDHNSTPVRQMRNVFRDAKLPLSFDQIDSLEDAVATRDLAIQYARSAESIRRANTDYNR